MPRTRLRQSARPAPRPPPASRGWCRARFATRAEPRSRSTRRGGGEVDVERVHHHRPTTPLDPETGQITGERAHVALAVAAMRAVVEVDVDLGLTRVVWVGTAQDVGKAMNPQAVHGQIEEDRAGPRARADGGDSDARRADVNASFTDYLIPTALDMPPVAVELVEDPEPDGPYGAKGVGEPPAIVSVAAIAAAVRDATGRELSPSPDPRRRHLPLAGTHSRTWTAACAVYWRATRASTSAREGPPERAFGSATTWRDRSQLTRVEGTGWSRFR